jgi:hypothetical protein
MGIEAPKYQNDQVETVLLFRLRQRVTDTPKRMA